VCGIVGYVGAGDADVLAAMLRVIAHRGPDGKGTWRGPGVGLGHRRLSIIDLAGGHQPMTNEDGTVWVVFNGEIYNYAELRARLEARGHSFSTASDTEAIVHGYEEWGTQCVELFQGMFAFALWDCRQRTLFCGRDRLGIKPFYFCTVDGTFIFGSEIKSLMAHPLVRPTLSRQAVHNYLTFRYVPAPGTIFEGVHKLAPGHVLTVSLADDGQSVGDPSVRAYWRLPDDTDQSITESEAVMQLGDLLSASVESRLVADVPVGAYLSGGLDSSVVVALMVQRAARQVSTFAVAFGDDRHDEREFSELAARDLGTEHRVLEATASGVDLVPKVLWHLDQPVADAACIPLYQMAEITKPHVTVVLSGEGADECFAGYPYCKTFAALSRLAPLFANRMMRRLADATRPATLRRAAAAIGWSDSAEGFVLRAMSYFDSDEKRRLYGPAMLDDYEQLDDGLGTFVEQHTAGPTEPFARFSKFLFEAWLPDDLLAKTDSMTMAHGIEARVPYLDHRLVEWAFRLPASLKLRGLQDKYILRRLASGLLPAKIHRRKKHGFSVPLEEWRGAELLEASREARDAMREAGVIDLPAWQSVADGPPRSTHHRRQQRAMWVLEQWWHHVFQSCW